MSLRDEIYRRYIFVNYGTIPNRYNKLIIFILTFTHCTITSIYHSGSAMALFHHADVFAGRINLCCFWIGSPSWSLFGAIYFKSSDQQALFLLAFAATTDVGAAARVSSRAIRLGGSLCA